MRLTSLTRRASLLCSKMRFPPVATTPVSASHPSFATLVVSDPWTRVTSGDASSSSSSSSSSSITTLQPSPATCAAVTAALELQAGPVDILTVTSASNDNSNDNNNDDDADGILWVPPQGVRNIIRIQTTTAVAPETVALATLQQYHNHTVTANDNNNATDNNDTTRGEPYRFIVGASTKFGSTVLPRIAGMLQTNPITDIMRILEPRGTLYLRPTYAGNALVQVRVRNNNATSSAASSSSSSSSSSIPLPPQVLTIRPTAFEKAPLQWPSNPLTPSVSIRTIPAREEFQNTVMVTTPPTSAPTNPSPNDDDDASLLPLADLTAASIVISGGRGMGSGDNFQLLQKLASALQSTNPGASIALGASRAAVDAGMVPNDWQVGQVRVSVCVCGCVWV